MRKGWNKVVTPLGVESAHEREYIVDGEIIIGRVIEYELAPYRRNRFHAQVRAPEGAYKLDIKPTLAGAKRACDRYAQTRGEMIR